jgi:type 1 glutamine amidotransferase
MLRKALLTLAVGLAFHLLAGDASAQSKIRVVIIDGQNNHDWRSTTPVIKDALEKTGRFTVDVSTSPPRVNVNAPNKPKNATEKQVAEYEAKLAKFKAELPKLQAEQKFAQEAMKNWRIDFDKYDVVLSNYNGDAWPKQVNDALESRLKEGKIALVIVHAANNAFGGWKEYNQMIGMGWRGANGGDRLFLDDKGTTQKIPSGSGDSSGHRYSGPFQVVVRDPSHPITKGMPSEWKHDRDELYDNMRGPIENVHLLATAYSKGTEKHEPMIWTVSYGKGRVFHTPMGHDANAMRCVGFQSTLARGTEWAATGNVTLAIPATFPTAAKTSSVAK